MTPLRRRMLEDMQVRNLSPNTQRAYLETVARFARHFGRSPAVLEPEQIRAYQVYLTQERKLAPSSLVIAACALRFLYKVTLKRARAWDAVIPGAREAGDLAGGPQSRRSGPLSRLRVATGASHDPDDLLCHRPPAFRKPWGSRSPPSIAIGWSCASTTGRGTKIAA